MKFLEKFEKAVVATNEHFEKLNTEVFNQISGIVETLNPKEIKVVIPGESFLVSFDKKTIDELYSGLGTVEGVFLDEEGIMNSLGGKSFSFFYSEGILMQVTVKSVMNDDKDYLLNWVEPK